MVKIAQKVGYENFTNNFSQYKSTVLQEAQKTVNAKYGIQVVTIKSLDITALPQYETVSNLNLKEIINVSNNKIQSEIPININYSINPKYFNSNSFSEQIIASQTAILSSVKTASNIVIGNLAKNTTGVTRENVSKLVQTAIMSHLSQNVPGVKLIDINLSPTFIDAVTNKPTNFSPSSDGSLLTVTSDTLISALNHMSSIRANSISPNARLKI